MAKFKVGDKVKWPADYGETKGLEWVVEDVIMPTIGTFISNKGGAFPLNMTVYVIRNAETVRTVSEDRLELPKPRYMRLSLISPDAYKYMGGRWYLRIY